MLSEISNCLLITSLFMLPEFNQATDKKLPLEIKTGIYVTQIFNLSSTSDNFQADFWLWMNYEGEKGNYFDLVEFFNSIEAKQVTRDTEEEKGSIWDSAKYSNKITTSWDVSNFPFDKQRLEFIVELAKSTNELRLIPDLKDSGINPEIKLDEWKILKTDLRVETVKYPSLFGSPKRTEPEEYSRMILQIDLCRNALSLFFKLHAGVYVAFAITMLAFFMNPAGDDIFSSRISLIVGMIFACLVNMQIIDSTVGKTTSLSLSDKIHILTLCSLFVSICIAIISRRFCERDEGGWSRKLDNFSLFFQTAAYIIANFVFIYDASNN